MEHGGNGWAVEKNLTLVPGAPSQTCFVTSFERPKRPEEGVRSPGAGTLGFLCDYWGWTSALHCKVVLQEAACRPGEGRSMAGAVGQWPD